MLADPTHFVFAKVKLDAKRMRDTTYIISCPNCQWEREVTYSQFHNLRKKKGAAECRPCLIKMGLLNINIEGLSKGRKYHSRKKERTNFSKNTKQMEIVATFGNSYTDETRQKMREAKLNKTEEFSNRWEGGLTPEKRKVRNEKIHQYQKQRMKKDKTFYVMKLVRNRVNSFIRNNNLKSFSKKLGCTLETFKLHIESQFKLGMTWENYGEWHIDHIFPLSKANNDDLLKKAVHYTNLQPLWAEENLKKSNKIYDKI